MQFSKSVLFYFLASAGVAVGDTTNSNLKDAVGDGGVNKMSFSLTYTNNDGSICSPCLLCEGSALPNVFDPKRASLCISCTGNDSCNEAIITNSFHKAWGMTYTSFVSHEGDASLDPDEISILASDDYDEGSDSGTWNKLATSSATLLFQQRNMPQHILFDNSAMYRHYRIVFRCKDNSNMMKIGHVGIVQSYTKTYAVQIFENITKSDVLGLVAPNPFGPAMVGFCHNLNGNFNGHRERKRLSNHDDSNDCLMSCYNYVMSSNLEDEHVSGCQSDVQKGCYVYNKNSYIASSGSGDTRGTCWVTGNQ